MMQRGILILSKEQILALLIYSTFDKLVVDKVNLEEENRIFVNEEELESILDEIGIVEDDEILLTARNKISDLLASFRNL